MTIRVLIVDDSPTMRAIVAARLSGHAGIQVVGLAGDAAEARAAMKALEPDVVTLDIEMPGMNGLEFLDKIMTLRPTPVIIVSSRTQAGSEITARALALGAVGTYCKSRLTSTPNAGNAQPIDDGGNLADLVLQAGQMQLRRRPAKTAPTTTKPASGAQSQISALAQRPLSGSRSPLTGTGPVSCAGPASGTGPRHSRLIVVGSSTGGVEALQVLLSRFPPNCPPTMIVQHIDARFTAAIARTLDAASPARVVVGEADMPLQRGMVYLAPGGEKHMTVAGGEALKVRLRTGEPIAGHRPSVDALFHSAAGIVGRDAVGILLTGMGADGSQGLLALARASALTIAQDEASCTIFGMPRVAISLGAAKVVAPLDTIATHALA